MFLFSFHPNIILNAVICKVQYGKKSETTRIFFSNVLKNENRNAQ